MKNFAATLIISLILSGCGVVAGEKALNMSPEQLTELSDNEMCFAYNYLKTNKPNQISTNFTKEFNRRNINCDWTLPIHAEKPVTPDNNVNASNNEEEAVAACYQKHSDGEFKTMTEAVKCEHNIYEQRGSALFENDNRLNNQYRNDQLKIARKSDAGKISNEQATKQMQDAYNKYLKIAWELQQKENEKQARMQAIEDARTAREQAKSAIEYERIREENKPSNIKCRSYGFKKGSVDFANCAMRIDQQEEQQQADNARYQALLQAERELQQREDERRKDAAIAQFFRKIGEPPPAPRQIHCVQSGIVTNCNY